MAFKSWEEAVQWLILQPDRQDLVRDCYYDRPPLQAARRYWKSDEWKAIGAYLPRGKGRVLDSGAGHGITSFALATDGWDVTALEPDPGDLVGAGAIRSLARESGLPIKVIQDVGEKIPCPDQEFDLVFSRQVLHHSKDLGKICREYFRVLKPGGMFFAVRDHVISSKKDLPLFLEKHPLHHLYGGENAYLFNEYREAILGGGFKIQQILRSLDSVINYAPFTEETLRDEFKSRLSRIPVLHFMSGVLLAKPSFRLLLKILSRVDRRPGRMFSFICRKP